MSSRVRCGFWLVVQSVCWPSAASYSPMAQRGSIAFGTMRLLTRSSVVTCGAAAIAASTAARLSSRNPQSKQRLLASSSCTLGAPSSSAAAMSVTAGSASISSSIASAASRASASVSATTAATGSPTWRTLPCASTGCLGSCIAWPKRSVTCQPQGMPPTEAKSSPVKMRITPGIAAAAAVSSFAIRPCATSERRKATCACPVRLRSSV